MTIKNSIRQPRTEMVQDQLADKLKVKSFFTLLLNSNLIFNFFRQRRTRLGREILTFEL